MLTSLNAFGGLSAAELLRLFGSNSPSSAPSSSATSTSPAQSASPAVSAADADDPLKKIKSILASAQMAQFSTAPSAGESVSGALVTAADAEQTGSGYALSFDGSNGSAVWGGGERTFAAQIQTGTSAAKSAADIAGSPFRRAVS